MISQVPVEQSGVSEQYLELQPQKASPECLYIHRHIAQGGM